MCRHLSWVDGQRMGRYLLPTAWLLFLTLSPDANAQTADEVEFPNLIGVGVGLTPDYPGARSRSLAAAPMFNYEFKDSERSISLFGPVASVNVVDDKAFHAGPMLRYIPGRSNVDDPVVNQLDDIDATVEAGAFISYGWTGKPNVPWQLRSWAAAFKSLGDEGGNSASLNAHFLMPLSHRVLLATGGSLNYLSSDSMETYYGVTYADSVRSGLPAFRPAGGKSSQDLWFGATFLINKNWAVGAGAYSQHLTGNAADSPIVTQRGRRDQVTVAAGLVYLWK